jgi:2-polyprenyl-3-methyl-5-hydroxy-6-metoxy-1,4-benzoquinol methylase
VLSVAAAEAVGSALSGAARAGTAPDRAKPSADARLDSRLVSDIHDNAVREQFRLQAETFTDEGFAARGLDWIVAGLRPAAGEQVLDVAAGAGHLGRALAPHVAHVSAIDLTPEMLAQGQQLAAGQGLRNIAFQVGNATALPWLDGQFDLVACRIVLHQVADPAAVVREMVRVTRPDGRIGIIDMIAAEDPLVAAETNRLERLRDPSHGRTLTEAELNGLLGAAGAVAAPTVRKENDLDFEDWMQRTQTPAGLRDELRERIGQELDGGAPTGLRPRRDENGTVTIVHTWAMITATPRR